MAPTQPVLLISNKNASDMFPAGPVRLGRRSKNGRQLKWPFFLLAFIVLCGVALWAYKLKEQAEPIQVVEIETPEMDAPSVEVAEAPIHEVLEIKGPFLSRISDRVRSGESLSAALSRHDVTNQEIHQVAHALRRKINLRTIQPGDVFVIEREELPATLAVSEKGSKKPDASALLAFELVQLDNYGVPTRYRATREKSNLLEKKDEPFYSVVRIETPVVKRATALSGKISSSLYEGILYAGGDPILVNRFSDVFAWQLDFYREAQKGDGFKMIVESRYADGRFIGYGRVLAAEYNNAGRQYRGFFFESEDGKTVGVFDEQGNSLERTFLKSPMELARITSRYGQRFHPVLKRRKRHNGVDYGAPRGTPFWVIADGVVEEARYSPTAGNMVRIRHRGGYTTEYFHASRIAPGVRVGSPVKQRQVIGYVGTTGRSTGPHLHFGMMKNKRYVNPAKQRFPAGKPVPARLVKSYLSKMKPLKDKLEDIEV